MWVENLKSTLKQCYWTMIFLSQGSFVSKFIFKGIFTLEKNTVRELSPEAFNILL